MTALTAILAATFSVPAAGQSPSYPTKPIRLIVPVAPGGNQDIVARAVAEPLARALGQQVLVESRPGVSATLGTRFVKTALPDGHTLLTISNTFVRTPAVMADAGYDAIKDFVAVSQTADVPLVLVVNPALPVKTVQELIALAKRRPGEITSAASGVGSTGHVATEAFSRRAGIRMLHVQYKGAAPAVVDLLGGHVMLRFDQVTTSLAHIRSGKLRALAVTSRTRSKVLPEVPTIEESGLKPFHDTTFNGVVAPAGTPRAIVERVHTEIARAVAAPELRGKFGQQGIDLTASRSPEEFGAFLRQQVEEFAVLAQEAGIRMQ
jgi:tripartite-type tricarboxylate transporter receptor subunit TctC